MHISLVMVGFADEGDSEARLESLAKDARAALEGFGSFGASLKNLGAFPSAAYVEAHDQNGEIDALREALLLGCGLKSKPGPPHLTLAYFQTEEETDAPEELVQSIEGFRDWSVGEIRVDAVDLTVLDLCKDYAEPQVFARLPL